MNILDEELNSKNESVFAEDERGNRFIIQVMEDKVYIEILLNKSFIE